MQKTVEKKLDNFFSQFRHVYFKKGEIIITAREPITYIYYLKKGLVKQSFITADGEDITHHIFKPISYFPIMLVLNNTPNNYTFSAIENLELQKAPAQNVISFLKEEPEVLFDLTTRFAEGLNKLLLKNENLFFKDAYIKVASLLLYLAKHFGKLENNQISITRSLTHNDIASWLGMQRETVSRQIEKLQKNGLVCYQNNVLIIVDISKLQQIVEFS